MRKLILGVWIALFAFCANAQEQERTQKTPEEMATWRVERLKSKLALNATQEEAVKTAMVTKITKAKEVREKHAGDKMAMKTAMEPIKTEFQNTMKSTLTQEQFTKWTEMREKRAEHVKHKKAAKQHMHHKEKHQKHEQKQNLEEK
jgi:hypothetical protein